jgi:hypothetical protein
MTIQSQVTEYLFTNELEMMRKEAVVAQFKALSRK